ncbi:hypothetical protein VB735_21265 [Halotia wernerae UHCC 0503]|nr:hypothetical protein [Halotia wernerae UHCC 0503]
MSYTQNIFVFLGRHNYQAHLEIKNQFDFYIIAFLAVFKEDKSVKI